MLQKPKIITVHLIPRDFQNVMWLSFATLTNGIYTPGSFSAPWDHYMTGNSKESIRPAVGIQVHDPTGRFVHAYEVVGVTIEGRRYKEIVLGDRPHDWMGAVS